MDPIRFAHLLRDSLPPSTRISLCAGGGGAGMGGAIFVMQENGQAGSLTLRGNVTTHNCTVIAGSGGCLSATAGAAVGSDLFLMHGTTLLCNPW